MRYEHATRILKKYVNDENVLMHCISVAEIAEQIAEAINENGHRINVEKVKSAALLHDVGRGIDHTEHERHSAEILQKEGFPELAEMVKTHGVRYERFGNEEFLPKTIEQKIVSYADGRDNKGKIVSLQERYALLAARRSPEYMKKAMQSFPRALQNEKELLKLAGVESFKI